MPDKLTLQESERHARRIRKLEHAAAVSDRLEMGTDAYGLFLTGIKLRYPRQAYGETLVVLTAVLDNTPVVAFHRAENAFDALSGALSRLHNDELKWKEDELAAK